MIYYTSDTHFGHKNIMKYENRPFNTIEEMNETLINNWNKKVKSNDDVYILGDFSFYSPTDIKNVNILNRLNGHKHLIIGNHDRFARKESFNKSLFESIDYYKEIEDEGRIVCLFHYPIKVWDKKHYGAYHCYGHIHSNMDLVDYNEDEKAFNVGVDVNNFEPMTLDELIVRNQR